MKKMILLCLITFPLYALAQIPIPKNAERIIVSTKENAKQGFKQCISKLLDMGYSIDKKDEDLLTIKTIPTKTKRRDISYYVNILCKDNEIIVSGMMDSEMDISLNGVTSKSSFEPITNRGMSGSIYRIAFEQMSSIAKALGEIIGYK